jgi:hypothetical protein
MKVFFCLQGDKPLPNVDLIRLKIMKENPLSLSLQHKRGAPLCETSFYAQINPKRITLNSILKKLFVMTWNKFSKLV